MDPVQNFCAGITPSWRLSPEGAYLDLTGTGRLLGRGADGPARVCAQARDTFMVISGGVGPTLLAARLASLLTARLQEHGVLVVPGGSVRAFLAAFPVGVLSDRAAGQIPRLQQLGVRTLGDLQVVPRPLLRAVFGPDADFLAAEADGSAFFSWTEGTSVSSASDLIAGLQVTRPLASAAAQSASLDALALRALAVCPGGPASRISWQLRLFLPGGARYQATTRSGETNTLAGWRRLLQGLWKRLPLNRQGLIRLELQAGGPSGYEAGQGLLFPEDERALRLALALGKINGQTGRGVRPASEQLLARWGVSWYGPSSDS